MIILLLKRVFASICTYTQVWGYDFINFSQPLTFYKFFIYEKMIVLVTNFFVILIKIYQNFTSERKTSYVNVCSIEVHTVFCFHN